MRCATSCEKNFKTVINHVFSLYWLKNCLYWLLVLLPVTNLAALKQTEYVDIRAHTSTHPTLFLSLMHTHTHMHTYKHTYIHKLTYIHR